MWIRNLFDPGSGIRDGKILIWNKYPVSATLTISASPRNGANPSPELREQESNVPVLARPPYVARIECAGCSPAHFSCLKKAFKSVCTSIILFSRSWYLDHKLFKYLKSHEMRAKTGNNTVQNLIICVESR
jgi:hypothetical protein